MKFRNLLRTNIVLSKGLFLGLVFIAFFPVYAHAQLVTGACNPACTSPYACNGDPIAPTCVLGSSDTGDGGNTGGGSGTQTCATGTHPDPLGTGACLPDQSSASPTATPGDKVPFPSDVGKDSEVWGVFASTIMSIFAWLMGIAALTLDTAMYYGVIAMSVFVKNVSAIGTTWRILRDVGNIMIIFGFLAIGISIILSTERFGWGRKMLPALLMSAVFLNFSLFFAQAVIDVGNLFATEIYTQINGGSAPTPHTLSEVISGNAGIATVIMNQLGLQGLYKSAQNPGQAQALFSGTSPLFVGMLGIILFLVTAFTLFTLAFILIARFVALVFIMILAPIGFAGFAIPQLESYASKWWHQLVEQTITAPVLLLMLYVALAIITDVKFLTAFGNQAGSGDSNWLGFIQGKDLAGFAGTSLSFIIAIGLLLAVTYLAKSMGAAGAGWATKWGGKLSFGLTGAALRTTAGLGLTRANTAFRNTRAARAFGGRTFANLLERGAKASYDVRGISAFGGLKAAGIDAGSAQKGGYYESEKKAIKTREDYAKTLGKDATEKEQEKTEKARKEMMEQTVKEIESQNKGDMEQLLRQHRIDMEPFAQEVNDRRMAAQKAERQLEIAKTTGNKTAEARTKAEFDAAQTAFNNALRDQEQKRAQQKTEQEDLKKEQNQTLKVQQDEVAARQKAIEEINRAPQLEYARNISAGIRGWRNRNKKAGDNIEKEAKKKKSEKDSDKLFELLEKASKKEEGKDKESGGDGKKSDH